MHILDKSFTSESFERALRYCRGNPDFYVRIYFDNRRKMQVVKDEIYREYKRGEVPKIQWAKNFSNNLIMHFDNGSNIDIAPWRKHNRKRKQNKAHYLIVDFKNDTWNDPFIEMELKCRLQQYDKERMESHTVLNDDGSISIQYSVIEPNRDTVASTDEMSDFLSCCLKPCS